MTVQDRAVIHVVINFVLEFVAMGIGGGSFISVQPQVGPRARQPAEAEHGAGSAASPSWRTRLEERFQARFVHLGR